MNDKTLPELMTDGLQRYETRTGHAFGPARAALFDMDGVLFDSMPSHAKAWMKMCREAGIDAREDEFYLYEGRTGASTINILFRRNFGREASEDEIKRLYRIKTDNFRVMPAVPVMHGATDALRACREAGIPSLLVTGSGQYSLMERLDREFPGDFPPGRRVTGRDVTHGKPSPEPYILGRTKAGPDIEPWQTVAVDNAPLGVTSAVASGAFTIGVLTGPMPPGTLLDLGADIELPSMEDCARALRLLFPVK